ncbi:MAG: RNA 2',3'-cyclic phosphodiesterase, partial [candidate division WOR-3 bacterium]
MRTFIAIKIPEKERKPIWALITEQKKKNLPIKWVEFENLHITLKFLGEIDEKKLERMIPLLSTISGKTKSFKMSLE